jgi:hypothetical protein
MIGQKTSRDFVRKASHWSNFHTARTVAFFNKKIHISDTDRFVIEIINISQQVKIDFFLFSGTEKQEETLSTNLNV